MKQIGNFISSHGADKSGLNGLDALYWNQTMPELVELSVRRGESRLSENGCVVVETGQHTGRSALDKFVVKRKENENDIWWDNNASMSEEQFENLYADFQEHVKGKTMFVQDLWGGADKATRLPVRVFTEYAWHALFIQHLLIVASNDELKDFIPEMTIINLPSFKANKERHGSRSDTIIACDLDRKIVLIANTSYAGENKKSVFTALNYILPTKNVMPMHCSVNVGENNDPTIFFGLSGTGKTTLSADPNRTLIGDDEHGWSGDVMFNFEGGCYAKMIKLSEEAEPEIYATTKMFGTVLENVIMDERTRKLDFDDATLTENTRGAYPISYIKNASLTGLTSAPKNIIMLTADAFGILPPLARLTPNEAMFHFISGYTAKVAGTEKGITEPTATFSTCFGAPFMPRHPAVYGNILRELIAKYNVDCWLVNTGWTGGKYGVGHRMPIKETRALLNAALSGALKNVEFRKDEYFGFEVPVSVDGVDNHILNPKNTWANKDEFDQMAAKLVSMFNDNFKKFEAHVDKAVLNAAPGKK